MQRSNGMVSTVRSRVFCLYMNFMVYLLMRLLRSSCRSNGEAGLVVLAVGILRCRRSHLQSPLPGQRQFEAPIDQVGPPVGGDISRKLATICLPAIGAKHAEHLRAF